MQGQSKASKDLFGKVSRIQSCSGPQSHAGSVAEVCQVTPSRVTGEEYRL